MEDNAQRRPNSTPLPRTYGTGPAYFIDGQPVEAVRITLNEIVGYRSTGVGRDVSDLCGTEGVDAVLSAFCEVTDRSMLSVEERQNLDLVKISFYSRPMVKRASSKGRAGLEQEIHNILEKYGFAAVAAELRTHVPTRSDAPRPRKPKVVLPKLPKGLAWPSETYSEANKERGENIIQFLKRVWAPLIAKGFGERRFISVVDPSTIDAIKNFERRNPATGEKRILPPGLRPMTIEQVNTAKLESDPTSVLSDPQLASVVATRLRRGKPTP